MLSLKSQHLDISVFHYKQVALGQETGDTTIHCFLSLRPSQSPTKFWSHIKILSLPPVGRKLLFNSSIYEGTNVSLGGKGADQLSFVLKIN